MPCLAKERHCASIQRVNYTMNESQGNSYKREFLYTIPESILHHSELTYLDKHIYMLVRSFMDTTGDAYPSNAWIARKCGVDRRTIINSLNRLVKHKAVGKMTDEKGHRHLFIPTKKIPAECVTGSDPNITPPVNPASPPSDPTFTQLDQSLINSKNDCVVEQPTTSELQKEKTESKAITDEKNISLFKEKFGSREVTIEEIFQGCQGFNAPKNRWVDTQLFNKWLLRENPENYPKKGSHESKKRTATPPEVNEYNEYTARIKADINLKLLSSDTVIPCFEEWNAKRVQS